MIIESWFSLSLSWYYLLVKNKMTRSRGGKITAAIDRAASDKHPSLFQRDADAISGGARERVRERRDKNTTRDVPAVYRL